MIAAASKLWTPVPVTGSARLGALESTYRHRMIAHPEIDALLDAMQAEFDKTGDHGDRPGLISFQRDNRIGMRLPTNCTSPARGIRYRGIQIKVSKERSTRVWTRAEALSLGETADSFEALKSLDDTAS